MLDEDAEKYIDRYGPLLCIQQWSSWSTN